MKSITCPLVTLSTFYFAYPNSNCRSLNLPSSRNLQTVKFLFHRRRKIPSVTAKGHSRKSSNASIEKSKQQENHFWKRKPNRQSGQKARALADIVVKLPNEKKAVYGALDKWVAWEEDFPSIAVAKALRILKRRNQWVQIIQVAKWVLSKGQVMTMGTCDLLIHAFDITGRMDEAEVLWETICQEYTRSVPRALFSRMIIMYERHSRPKKLIEVFADMEELGVKPDETTVNRIAGAFKKLGMEDKRDQVLTKYRPRWKYLYFNGEKVRVPYDAM